jgi:hypothetical protein
MAEKNALWSISKQPALKSFNYWNPSNEDLTEAGIQQNVLEAGDTLCTVATTFFLEP